MSNENFYEEKIREVTTLISKEEYKKANTIILEELNMPYVPSKYEEQFNTLLEIVKPNLIVEKTSNAIPRDVAIEYLLSEDDDQESIGLEVLREHNLRYDVEVIKRRLETWPIEKNIKKAYLFELLVEQEIDIDVDFNGISLNPKNGSILEKEEVKDAFLELGKLFNKNPSQLQFAEEEMQRFLLMTYPAVPEKGSDLALNIAKVVENMFDQEVKLTETQEKIKEFMAR